MQILTIGQDCGATTKSKLTPCGHLVRTVPYRLPVHKLANKHERWREGHAASWQTDCILTTWNEVNYAFFS